MTTAAPKRPLATNELARFRADLLDRVAKQTPDHWGGTIEPDMAEELAEQFADFGQLSVDADPTSFDMSKLEIEWWTFGMGLAWLAWQTRVAVRELFPDYVHQRIGWHDIPPESGPLLGLKDGQKPGWALVPDQPLTAVQMIQSEREGYRPHFALPMPVIPVEAALGLLVGELLDPMSGVTGSADRLDNEDTIDLPASAWATLAFGELKNNAGQSFDVLCRLSTRKPLYMSARIPRVAVMGIIPRMIEEARTISGTASKVPTIVARGRGRPKGAKNWDNRPFVAEYRRRLELYGEPSRQNVRGWTSKGAAASTVMDLFTEKLADDAEHPSPGSGTNWGKETIAAWKNDGEPRATQ